MHWSGKVGLYCQGKIILYRTTSVIFANQVFTSDVLCDVIFRRAD